MFIEILQYVVPDDFNTYSSDRSSNHTILKVKFLYNPINYNILFPIKFLNLILKEYLEIIMLYITLLAQSFYWHWNGKIIPRENWKICNIIDQNSDEKKFKVVYFWTMNSFDRAQKNWIDE